MAEMSCGYWKVAGWLLYWDGLEELWSGACEADEAEVRDRDVESLAER